MSSYSMQIGQLKGIFDIYIDHFFDHSEPKMNHYQMISEQFFNFIYHQQRDYHHSEIFHILSLVEEKSIANRVRKLESKFRNKRFDLNFIDWKMVERGYLQEKQDYLNTLKFIEVFSQTKTHFKRLYDEDLVSKGYAEILQTNFSNLKRMLNHSQEVEPKLLTKAENYLQELSNMSI